MGDIISAARLKYPQSSSSRSAKFSKEGLCRHQFDNWVQR